MPEKSKEICVFFFSRHFYLVLVLESSEAQLEWFLTPLHRQQACKSMIKYGRHKSNTKRLTNLHYKVKTK